MKIEWLGHASFLITSENGIKIICDPYSPVKGELDYGQIKESAHIVTVSHGHSDHNNVRAIKGDPAVVDTARECHILLSRLGGIPIRGIASYHDHSKGKQRGKNIVFCFIVDGIRVCHLGDLGHELSERRVAEIGKVDVLLIPVGGFYTVDGEQASKICEKMNPRYVIPMHYKTEKLSYPIAGVEDFLRDRNNVRRLGVSEMEIRKGHLPSVTQTIVLEHAL